MAPQQTIREPISYSGAGLHSGQRVTLRFLPAEPDSGIRFRRVDLEGRPEVEACVDLVSETNRSTTLAKGNIKIHTVEHVLATLAGFGISNATVELDANEPPIADGSARPFCEMIQTAGIQTQGVESRPFRVEQAMEVRSGETEFAVFPHDRLKISCTSSDRLGRFTQYFSLEVSPESWERELAAARTFCFFEEIEFLIRNGLIKGGSLENAVVIRDDAVLTTEPLRFQEEFVRHKILDMIGDLALLGRPLQAHIIAVRPSHSANCELARQLRKLMESKPTERVEPTQAAPLPPETLSAPPSTEPSASGPPAMSIDEILKMLPHRYPFLLVDRVLSLEGERILAVKNVTINEPFFQGHFPAQPIMPGVLQLEAIAQVAGILLYAKVGDLGRVAYFLSAEKVKWRKPVRPGDQLAIEVTITKFRGKIAKAAGTCSVDGDVVSEAEVTLMLGT